MRTKGPSIMSPTSSENEMLPGVYSEGLPHKSHLFVAVGHLVRTSPCLRLPTPKLLLLLLLTTTMQAASCGQFYVRVKRQDQYVTKSDDDVSQKHIEPLTWFQMMISRPHSKKRELHPRAGQGRKRSPRPDSPAFYGVAPVYFAIGLGIGSVMKIFLGPRRLSSRYLIPQFPNVLLSLYVDEAEKKLNEAIHLFGIINRPLFFF